MSRHRSQATFLQLVLIAEVGVIVIVVIKESYYYYYYYYYYAAAAHGSHADRRDGCADLHRQALECVMGLLRSR